MNKSTSVRRYLVDQHAATAVEFGLLSLLFVGVFVGILDMARLAWEMNSAKAATRAGARFATSNVMVSTYLQNFNAMTSGLVTGNGMQVPVSAGLLPPIICTSTSTATTAADGNTTCVGNGGSGQTARNTAAFNAVLARMRAYHPRLRANNVQIEYRHVGIGFAGNPYAPDVEPLITVRVRNMTFSPGALRLFGITSLAVPPASSTMSGEDLS
jgi:Flp pilus assembly pilin Flp